MSKYPKQPKHPPDFDLLPILIPPLIQIILKPNLILSSLI